MKISINTQKVLNYITDNIGKGITTDKLILDGMEPKQIAGSVSVLIRKGLINKSPFILAHKYYLKDKSASTLEELKILVNEFLIKETYSTKPIISFFKTHSVEKNIMKEYVKFDGKIVKMLWHFVYGPEIPICCNCQKQITKFKNFKIGYNKYCSKPCEVEYVWNNITAEKIKIRSDKTRIIFKERYGEDWYSKTDEYNAKVKSTCLERYGVTNAAKLENSKIKATKFFDKKYGGQGSGSPLIAAKIKATMNEKYGVDYAWQIPEVQDKIQESRFMFKDYIFPSGRTERVQGYEPRAIDLLLFEGVKEDDMVVSNKAISDLIGPIFYESESKRKRYFPDLYIKSTNTLIEVKSTYTYYGPDHREVILKREASIAAGFNYRFMIFDRTKLIEPFIE